MTISRLPLDSTATAIDDAADVGGLGRRRARPVGGAVSAMLSFTCACWLGYAKGGAMPTSATAALSVPP